MPPHSAGRPLQFACDARPAKIRAPGPKPIILPAIHANRGTEALYREALRSLIAEMQNSIGYWLAAAWRRAPPRASMAQDADPIVTLSRVLRRLGDHWTKRFNDVSQQLAERFADKSKRNTDAAMMAALKRAGFTIGFKATASMMEAYGAVVAENVALIKSIPVEYLDKVQGAVWRTVKGGYDLEALKNELFEKCNAPTLERAAFIASDQANKAKAAIEARRRSDLGIKQAIWQHSGAGKVPRPSHVEAGRKNLVFDLDTGAFIDGEWIFPGELINCRCTSRAIIPGLHV